ncbi:MAG: endonuclease/exonuclease/phosphatase family protein [Anaerolineae bacterium]|nr:endonuclease/exonuclease/phosphatase family protein [Anaerolineae bacterium]MDW8170962.1 endonuclease/exonuclease/phosphatase family protein [Anaerolineae bacterium]
MTKRFFGFLRARSPQFAFLEAVLVGWFFVQSLRFLVASLYSRIASAAVLSQQPSGAPLPVGPGIETLEAINAAISFLGLMLALPLLALALGRWRWLSFIALLILAISRALIVLSPTPSAALIAAQVSVGAALLYLSQMIRYRATLFPYLLIFGLALDQLWRAFGDTQDPSLLPAYANLQGGLSLTLIILGLLSHVFGLITERTQGAGSGMVTSQATLTLWGGVALGAWLYLQLALFALPNAIAGRANADYALLVPAALAATLLPIMPWVRHQARRLIAPLDSLTRGWVWIVFMALFIIIGLRLPRLDLGALALPLGAAALVLAQVALVLLLWWFIRPKAQTERNLTPLWLLMALLVFGLFVVADIFTYEYAFVRDFVPPLNVLNAFVPPLLRGLRGMGLGVLLVGGFLATLPMIQSNQRIAWAGRGAGNFASLLLIIAMSAGAGWAARPPLVLPVLNEAEIRVGTYNIHHGYSAYFAQDLEGIAQAILQSGAQIVLLQEVDKGRLTSFGVDQTLWLGRRLGMDRRFFPTNEGLMGLAVLSRIPIVFDDGVLLPSLDTQTGLQRVQVRPDEGVLTLYNINLGLLLVGESIEAQEANQRAQLNAALAVIATHIERDYNGRLGRTILGGTFNNVPDSPLLRTLEQTGFVDPFAGANLALAATVVRGEQRARLDYLWLWSESLRSSGSGVIASAASNHHLAFVGVEIRRGS